MKTTPRLALLCGLVAGCGALAGAAPVEFPEVSLLVRMHESDAYIRQQVASRRLLRPLSTSQEAALQAQGASAGLVLALRGPELPLAETEAAAFESERERRKLAQQQSEAAEEAARFAAASRQAAIAGQPVTVPAAQVPAPVVSADAYPDYPVLGYPGIVRGRVGYPGAEGGRSYRGPDANGSSHRADLYPLAQLRKRPSIQGSAPVFTPNRGGFGINGPAPMAGTAPGSTTLGSNTVFTPGHR